MNLFLITIPHPPLALCLHVLLRVTNQASSLSISFTKTEILYIRRKPRKMKTILFIVAFSSMLWNGKGLSQGLPISNGSLLSCDPPFIVMGLYDPAVPNDPDPAIFSQEVKNELMSDGFQGKDKEYGDIDNDGDIDILYTTDDNQLWLLPNTGDATSPEYLIDNKIFTGFVGVHSFRLMDWYGDGIKDLAVLEDVVGNPININLFLDINAQIGFPAPIAILIDGALVPISADQFIEVGDIDGDQFPEILVSGQGAINGTAAFKNFGTGWSFPPTYRLIAPQTYASPMIPENGGSSPCPELFDADCDGDLDLFISDPLWAGGGGHVDYYENTGPGSPLLFFTKISPNPYGLDDIALPNTDLSCDWVITRFADFFGDGAPEAIAYNPCSNNHPDGDIFYYNGGNSCTASFTFGGPEFCQTFQFTNTSSSSVSLNFTWNFGDPSSGTNNTSSLQHPSHSFTACGSYNVCLRISGNGCDDTFCQVINVTDPIPPVAVCLGGIGIVLDANCIATATAASIDGGSFDNCLLTSLSLSPDTFNQCGLFPVTLTVTDWCGNTNTCLSAVQVIDLVPLSITCPPNIHLSTISPNCTMVVNGLQWLALTDICGSALVTYSVTGASTYAGVGDASGLTFNAGTSLVTYTARDNCGNTETCSFEVVLDCVCDCPDNLLLNPGFYEGAIAGNLNQSGHSNAWHTGQISPQIVAEDSCCDAYSVQMWGWLYDGESIYQDGLTFLAGHQYKISFCARYLPAHPIANNVIFGFTAANANSYPYQCTSCEDIGSSPQISNTNWITYTLPIWTPTQNWNTMVVRVYHSMGIQTWGRIDNICVEEVFRSCCEDEDAFVENIKNAVQISVDERSEEIVFSIGHLPECDSIEYIDWGNGEITQGPFGGDVVRRNRFLDHVLAKVQYLAHEYDQSDTSHQICFEVIGSDSVETRLSSTQYNITRKSCKKADELQKKIEWNNRIVGVDHGGRSDVKSTRYHIQTAILKPIVFPPPLIKLSDELGLPVKTTAGEEIALFRNDLIGEKIESLHPAPLGYHWYGLQSNLLTPTNATEKDSLVFSISTTWIDLPDGSEDSTGAIWISDDKDDLYGEYILDGLAYYDSAVTTFSTVYGLRFKIVCKYNYIMPPPPAQPYWYIEWMWDWWARDSGGRGNTDSPYHLQAAILKANVLEAPIISLTDSLGNPLLTDAGEVIRLIPNESVTSKIQRLYPAPLGYGWYGLLSNQLTPTSSKNIDSLNFRMAAQWVDVPGGIQDSTGAFWVSDDKDDLYGELITDGFTLLGAAILDTTTSVNPALTGDKIVLYPNPTTAELTISWGDMNLGKVSVAIVDCYGKLQRASLRERNSNHLTIDVKDLPEGIFFIKILTEGRVVRVLKFVKMN